MARYRHPVHLMGPTRVAVPSRIPDFGPALRDIEEGLHQESMFRVRIGATAMLDLLVTAYRLPRIHLSVLDRPRPSLGGRRFSGELHGDYTPAGESAALGAARIRLWARTAKRGQRVAFLTFLDTLLHEFLHHYDLMHLKLPDTVHSENFYKRLGSLRGLVRRTEERHPPAPTAPAAPRRPPPERPAEAPLQMRLPF